MTPRRSTARLAAEGAIAFVWRMAERRSWNPRRTRKEFLIARNDFVARFLPEAGNVDGFEIAERRLLATWYRAASAVVGKRLRALPDLRQLEMFGGRR